MITQRFHCIEEIHLQLEKPTPVNKAVKLDKYKYIMSRTDARGIIEYGNDYFFEISGYRADELIGKPHSIVRHPDMPKVIFKLMWNRIQSGKGVFAVVKNLAKDGRYYWVTTKFEIHRDPSTKLITGYLAYRQAARPSAVATIEELYGKLLEAEQRGGVEASEAYLVDFLESKGMSYDEYIDDVIENRGAFKLFFQAMRKLLAP